MLQEPTISPPGVISDHTCCFHTIKPCYVCHRVCVPEKVCVSFSPTRTSPVSHSHKNAAQRSDAHSQPAHRFSGGNPPVHKEARYDTTSLQAREGAGTIIDMATTFVWESPCIQLLLIVWRHIHSRLLLVCVTCFELERHVSSVMIGACDSCESFFSCGLPSLLSGGSVLIFWRWHV